MTCDRCIWSPFMLSSQKIVVTLQLIILFLLLKQMPALLRAISLKQWVIVLMGNAVLNQRRHESASEWFQCLNSDWKTTTSLFCWAVIVVWLLTLVFCPEYWFIFIYLFFTQLLLRYLMGIKRGMDQDTFFEAVFIRCMLFFDVCSPSLIHCRVFHEKKNSFDCSEGVFQCLRREKFEDHFQKLTFYIPTAFHFPVFYRTAGTLKHPEPVSVTVCLEPMGLRLMMVPRLKFHQ